MERDVRLKEVVQYSYGGVEGPHKQQDIQNDVFGN